MEGEGKQFFFEKKNQKTFDTWGVFAGSMRAPMNKSFCFFFQKEALPFTDASPAGAIHNRYA
jgi:hypothetical protein